jgi:DNA repair exonuclease SbcCD ATPase subunit/predicted phosphodiesterase
MNDIPKYTIFHLADIHIKNSNRDELKQAIDAAGEYIRNYESPKKIMVIAGDIFNSKSKLLSSENITDYFYLINSFVDLVSRIIIIPGNHDYDLDDIERIDLLTPLQNEIINNFREKILYFSKNISINIDGINFHVISPLDSYDDLPIPAKQDGVLDIAIIHEWIKDYRFNNINGKFENISIKNLSQYDIVLCGHIHDYGFVTDKIAYCGSLIQQTIGETIIKGFIKWDITENNEIIPQFIRIYNNKGYLKYIIDNNGKHLLGNIDENEHKIPESPSKIIVKLCYPNHELFEKTLEELRNRYNIEPTRQITCSAKEYKYEPEKLIDIRDQKDTTIRDFLEEKHVERNMIDKIIQLHDEISKHTKNKIVNLSCKKWTLLSLEWEGLFCYNGKNSINFESLGNSIIGIIGKNRTGKSAILDILIFGLFNKHLRTHNVNNIINKNNPNNYSIKISFVIDNNKHVIIRQLISGKKTACYLINDEIITRNADKMYEIIRSFIGTYDEFRNTTFLSQDVGDDFKQEGNMQEKEILLNILGISDFVCENERVAKKAKLEKNSELKFINKKNIVIDEEKINLIKKDLDEMKEKKQNLVDDISSIENDILNLTRPRNVEPSQQKLERTNAKINQIKDDLQRLEQKLSVFRGFEHKIQPFDSQKLREQIIALNREYVNDVDPELDVKKSKGLLKELEKELNITQGICDLDTQLQEIDDKMLDLGEKDRLNEEMRILLNKINDIKEQKEKIEKEIAGIPETNISDNDIALLESTLSELKQKHKSEYDNVVDPALAVADIQNLEEDLKKLGNDKLLCMEMNRLQSEIQVYDKKMTISSIKQGLDMIERILCRYQCHSIDELQRKIAQRMDEFESNVEINKESCDKFQFSENCSSCQFNLSLFDHAKSSNELLLEINLLKDDAEVLNSTQKNMEILEKAERIEEIRRKIGNVSAVDIEINIKSTEKDIDEAMFSINNVRVIEEQGEILEKIIEIEEDLEIYKKIKEKTEKSGFIVKNLEFLEEKYAGITKKVEILQELMMRKGEVMGKIGEFGRSLAKMRLDGTRNACLIKEEIAEHEKIVNLEEKIVKNRKISDEIAKIECEIRENERIIKAQQGKILIEGEIKVGNAEISKLSEEKLDLEAEISEILREIDEYNRHADKRERLCVLKKEAEDVEVELRELILEIGMLEKERERSIADLARRNELEDEVAVYDMYIGCLDRKSGIPCMLLESALGMIENHANNFLCDIGDFKVRFIKETTDKSIVFHPCIEYKGKRTAASLGSGYQRFVLSIVLRQALLQTSCKPMADFMIIDEGFGCLDDENMIQVCKYLPYLKNMFKFVLIISHIDRLKADIEEHLHITSVDGNSSIEYGEITMIPLPIVRKEEKKVERKKKKVMMMVGDEGENARNCIRIDIERKKAYCVACKKEIGIGYKDRHVKSDGHVRALEKAKRNLV